MATTLKVAKKTVRRSSGRPLKGDTKRVLISSYGFDPKTMERATARARKLGSSRTDVVIEALTRGLPLVRKLAKDARPDKLVASERTWNHRLPEPVMAEARQAAADRGWGINETMQTAIRMGLPRG
ncbi:MAG: hypothetical protein IPH13_20495 [Planctomycetes bacterium]|nr:hypothetical protein [Planctomycetota bacterium]